MKRAPILLVNPNRMRPPIAPLGLDYVANALEHRGYEPILCDLTFAHDEAATIERALDETRPAAVAVSVRNLDDAYFASRDFVLEKTAVTIGRIKAMAAAPVILGGVGFSIAPREVLHFTSADYGIAGDGEAALPDLLDCLRSGGDSRRAPGVVRLEDPASAPPPAPALCEPDLLPPRTRVFVDNARYFREGGQAGLETKRGCGQRCIYCVEPQAKGAATRMSSPERVAGEFARLLEQGCDVVHLCDSEFNLPRAHAEAVCRALIETGLAERVRWYAYASPRPFDTDLARLMARAGCAGVNFGVDHGETRMLRRLQRGHEPRDIRETARACHEVGLTVMFDMLLGGPGETRDTIAAALDFMRSAGPDRVGLSCGVRVYPHTPLARHVLTQGPLDRNPHLHGALADNDSLLRPIFYVESTLGAGIHAAVSELVGGDSRFLHADPAQVDGNYNYNDNSVLAEAIRRGERGAYWDILRRISADA